MLFAAAVHDFEHTGTTNNFHVQTKSRLAMIYNDRSVLENHHLSVAFRLLQNPDIDILMGLSKDEFKVLFWNIFWICKEFSGLQIARYRHGSSYRHVAAFSGQPPKIFQKFFKKFEKEISKKFFFSKFWRNKKASENDEEVVEQHEIDGQRRRHVFYCSFGGYFASDENVGTSRALDSRLGRRILSPRRRRKRKR